MSAPTAQELAEWRATLNRMYSRTNEMQVDGASAGLRQALVLAVAYIDRMTVDK